MGCGSSTGNAGPAPDSHGTAPSGLKLTYSSSSSNGHGNGNGNGNGNSNSKSKSSKATRHARRSSDGGGRAPDGSLLGERKPTVVVKTVIVHDRNALLLGSLKSPGSNKGKPMPARNSNTLVEAMEGPMSPAGTVVHDSSSYLSPSVSPPPPPPAEPTEPTDLFNNSSYIAGKLAGTDTSSLLPSQLLSAIRPKLHDLLAPDDQQYISPNGPVAPKTSRFSPSESLSHKQPQTRSGNDSSGLLRLVQQQRAMSQLDNPQSPVLIDPPTSVHADVSLEEGSEALELGDTEGVHTTTATRDRDRDRYDANSSDSDHDSNSVDTDASSGSDELFIPAGSALERIISMSYLRESEVKLTERRGSGQTSPVKSLHSNSNSDITHAGTSDSNNDDGNINLGDNIGYESESEPVVYLEDVGLDQLVSMGLPPSHLPPPSSSSSSNDGNASNRHSNRYSDNHSDSNSHSHSHSHDTKSATVSVSVQTSPVQVVTSGVIETVNRPQSRQFVPAKRPSLNNSAQSTIKLPLPLPPLIRSSSPIPKPTQQPDASSAGESEGVRERVNGEARTGATESVRGSVVGSPLRVRTAIGTLPSPQRSEQSRKSAAVMHDRKRLVQEKLELLKQLEPSKAPIANTATNTSMNTSTGNIAGTPPDAGNIYQRVSQSLRPVNTPLLSSTTSSNKGSSQQAVDGSMEAVPVSSFAIPSQSVETTVVSADTHSNVNINANTNAVVSSEPVKYLRPSQYAAINSNSPKTKSTSSVAVTVVTEKDLASKTKAASRAKFVEYKRLMGLTDEQLCLEIKALPLSLAAVSQVLMSFVTKAASKHDVSMMVVKAKFHDLDVDLEQYANANANDGLADNDSFADNTSSNKNVNSNTNSITNPNNESSDNNSNKSYAYNSPVKVNVRTSRDSNTGGTSVTSPSSAATVDALYHRLMALDADALGRELKTFPALAGSLASNNVTGKEDVCLAIAQYRVSANNGNSNNSNNINGNNNNNNNINGNSSGPIVPMTRANVAKLPIIPSVFPLSVNASRNNDDTNNNNDTVSSKSLVRTRLGSPFARSVSPSVTASSAMYPSTSNNTQLNSVVTNSISQRLQRTNSMSSNNSTNTSNSSNNNNNAPLDLKFAFRAPIMANSDSDNRNNSNNNSSNNIHINSDRNSNHNSNISGKEPNIVSKRLVPIAAPNSGPIIPSRSKSPGLAYSNSNSQSNSGVPSGAANVDVSVNGNIGKSLSNSDSLNNSNSSNSNNSSNGISVPNVLKRHRAANALPVWRPANSNSQAQAKDTHSNASQSHSHITGISHPITAVVVPSSLDQIVANYSYTNSNSNDNNSNEIAINAANVNPSINSNANTATVAASGPKSSLGENWKSLISKHRQTITAQVSSNVNMNTESGVKASKLSSLINSPLVNNNSNNNSNSNNSNASPSRHTSSMASLFRSASNRASFDTNHGNNNSNSKASDTNSNSDNSSNNKLSLANMRPSVVPVGGGPSMISRIDMHTRHTINQTGAGFVAAAASHTNTNMKVISNNDIINGNTTNNSNNANSPDIDPIRGALQPSNQIPLARPIVGILITPDKPRNNRFGGPFGSANTNRSGNASTPRRVTFDIDESENVDNNRSDGKTWRRMHRRRGNSSNSNSNSNSIGGNNGGNEGFGVIIGGGGSGHGGSSGGKREPMAYMMM